MSASPATRISARRRPSAKGPPETRFDRRLGKILALATEVFCEKGYEGASMRDLSRASGMSLAGLYYYFESKERLLYLVQKHTFTTILEQLKSRLEGAAEPEGDGAGEADGGAPMAAAAFAASDASVLSMSKSESL